MEEQNQNWKDVIYEQVPEKENKPKKNKSKKMKHMKLVVGAAIAAGVLVPAVFGSFYQIQEQEQAVLVTFGKPKAVTETGLHFKLPCIQEVRKVNTTIQGFPVGYTEENNEMVEAESIMITSDYNFIDVDFFVEYRISDPVAYLYGSREPEQILRNISQSCIRNVIGSYVVDDVLTTGKSEIQAKIKEMIMAQLEQQEIGLMLTNITKHLYSHRKFFIFCFHNSAASFPYILSDSVQSCTVILSCPEKILNVKYPKKRPFSDNKSYLRKVFFISNIFLF